MTLNPRIAIAQYAPGFLGSWDDYVAKITDWVARGVAGEGGGSAQLLLFPEYAAMELTSLLGDELFHNLIAQRYEMQFFVPDFIALHQGLAQKYGVYIVAASLPVLVGEEFRNRVYFCHPDGRVEYQDKIMMTRFECEEWFVAGDSTLKIFETSLGKIGIATCYDSEFPMIARRMAEAGAMLLLVPSNTETWRGYWRVRIGSQARALENQIYVAHSPCVGNLLTGSPSVEENHGIAALYCPPDKGMAENGVVAIGEPDAVQWVFAELDYAALESVRRDGAVFNHRDWPEHIAACETPVQSISF